MAEQSAEQPDVVEGAVVKSDQTTVTPPEDIKEGYVVPRGTIAFAILMIIGYAFYFFMIWSEVVGRGGQ